MKHGVLFLNEDGKQHWNVDILTVSDGEAYLPGPIKLDKIEIPLSCFVRSSVEVGKVAIFTTRVAGSICGEEDRRVRRVFGGTGFDSIGNPVFYDTLGFVFSHIEPCPEALGASRQPLEGEEARCCRSQLTQKMNEILELLWETLDRPNSACCRMARSGEGRKTEEEIEAGRIQNEFESVRKDSLRMIDGAVVGKLKMTGLISIFLPGGENSWYSLRTGQRIPHERIEKYCAWVVRPGQEAEFSHDGLTWYEGTLARVDITSLADSCEAIFIAYEGPGTMTCFFECIRPAQEGRPFSQ